MIKFAIFLTSLSFIILIFVILHNGEGMIKKVILSNTFSTFVTIFIILLAALYNEPDFIDIALIYVILSFAVSATLLFLTSSNSQIVSKK